MLVLVGGSVVRTDDQPAVGLVLGSGTHALGHTIEGAAFPRSPDLPRVFEGSQCFLEVQEEIRITRDVSTNGTLVVPAREARLVPVLRHDRALRRRWEGVPCPKPLRLHDILLTAYAELVLVLP
jgi:hypothetical protein